MTGRRGRDGLVHVQANGTYAHSVDVIPACYRRVYKYTGKTLNWPEIDYFRPEMLTCLWCIGNHVR